MYRFGLIGFGKMGSAIIEGAIKNNVLNKSELLICVKREEQYLDLTMSGYNVTLSNEDIYKKCDIILLAIKPQMLDEVGIKAYDYNFENKCIASILAGVKIDKLKSIFKNAEIVRIMPNTPALIAKCVATISYTSDNENVKSVLDIFKCIGEYEIIDENLMDETLPLNGSMPAYIYLFIKLFIENALKNGVDYEVAKMLAINTIKASCDMILESNDSIDTLISNVCSKGGTTISGLDKLYSNGFDKAIEECYNACMNRSKELSK